MNLIKIIESLEESLSESRQRIDERFYIVLDEGKGVITVLAGISMMDRPARKVAIGFERDAETVAYRFDKAGFEEFRKGKRFKIMKAGHFGSVEIDELTFLSDSIRRKMKARFGNTYFTLLSKENARQMRLYDPSSNLRYIVRRNGKIIMPTPEPKRDPEDIRKDLWRTTRRDI